MAPLFLGGCAQVLFNSAKLDEGCWRAPWPYVTMSEHEMRKHALRRYVVFRVKAMEFLDIATLRQALKAKEFCPRTPVNRTSNDFADSLRTVQLSWFALFVDKSHDGLNVIELWKELFPKHRQAIQDAWTRMAPAWDVLREFRDRAGFHADKPPRFFNARRRVLLENRLVTGALNEFEQLFKILLNAEGTELPELEQAVDSLLDELEGEHGHKYDRSEFKRYLILPSTSGSSSH